jgi:hypothetical protein
MIHRGGRRVSKEGLYWSIIDGTMVEMSEGAVLPGGRKVIYMRRPPGGAYVVVPAIVLLVVLTLPLTSTMGYLIAWFAPLVIVAAGVLFVCGKLVYYAYSSASEGWEPLKAYFTGKRNKRK